MVKIMAKSYKKKKHREGIRFISIEYLRSEDQAKATKLNNRSQKLPLNSTHPKSYRKRMKMQT
jgi:hypothetical protein